MSKTEYINPLDIMDVVGYPPKSERRKDTNDAKKGMHYEKGLVIQCKIDGTVVGIYKTTMAAMRDTGIDERNISSVLTGKTKTAGGYIWKRTTTKQQDNES